MSYQWIEKLEESNSRLHKEEVVKQCLATAMLGDEDAIRFLLFVGFALSPYATFGVKQIPFSTSDATTDNWEKYANLLVKLGTRSVTGHAARDAVLDAMNNMTRVAWDTLARRILIKDLRCGTSEKTFNKFLKGTDYEIPIFQAQLAQDGSDQPKKLVGKKRLEVKLDGVRVLAMVIPTASSYEVVLLSRNGKELTNFPKIESAIADRLGPRVEKWFRSEPVFLDGEIMSSSFQDLMKHAHRKNKKADTDNCVFHVFDLIPREDFHRGYWNKPQRERTKLLQKILPESFDCDSVKFMPGITVDLDTTEGQQQLKRFNKDAIEAGFEGVMVKDLDAPYVCKRPDYWLKIKPTITVDLVAKKVEEGTGKHAGRMGAILFEGVDDGKEISVSCGSGYSDKDREDIWAARDSIPGMIGEVEADAISQNQDGSYSLRFPRFKTWRGFVPGEKI